MSRRTPTVLILALATLAGCAGPRPQTPATRASAAAAASCRASTESSFNRQNRYLLSERNTTDSPFSTSRRHRHHHAWSDPAIRLRHPAPGLPDRFGRRHGPQHRQPTRPADRHGPRALLTSGPVP